MRTQISGAPNCNISGRLSFQTRFDAALLFKTNEFIGKLAHHISNPTATANHYSPYERIECRRFHCFKIGQSKSKNIACSRVDDSVRGMWLMQPSQMCIVEQMHLIQHRR